MILLFFLIFIPGLLGEICNVIFFGNLIIQSTDYSLCGTIMDAVNSIRDVGVYLSTVLNSS